MDVIEQVEEKKNATTFTLNEASKMVKKFREEGKNFKWSIEEVL